MSGLAGEEGEWEDAGAIDSEGHGGPWPAFVDLFAATTLILLVFFAVIAYRYVDDVGDTVRVRQLYDQLQGMEARSGQFAVQQQGPDVLLVLEERVSFQTGQAALLDPARHTLRQVLHLLDEREFEGLIREIEVLGHADRRGNAFKNWLLSANRAVSVSQFLVDSLGLSPCIVIASGRGAYFPRDTTVRPESLRGQAQLDAYARDRRVEILLHPAVGREKAVGRRGCREGALPPA
jgi:outer membrane protein OmpA-like peptidoglycan-associated protein